MNEIDILDTAIRKLPLTDEAKKKVEEIQKSPEFRLIIINEILETLKKDRKNPEEEISAYHTAKALSKLIKI